MWADLGTFALKVVCTTITIICLVLAFYTAGPGLETKYWPVVSKLRVISEEVTPDGWIKIRVQFTKLRDCDYVGISWFVGQRMDEFERVPVTLMRDPKDIVSPNRPLGTQRAGPWIIGVTPEEFRKESFAQLQHRCWPFWTSVTDFYP